MSKKDKPVALTEARDRRTQSLEEEAATLRRRLEEATHQLKVKDEQIDTQAQRLEGCTSEIGRLRAEVDAYAKAEQQSVEALQRALGFEKPEEMRKWQWVLDAVEELKQKANATPKPPPPHAVRAFEAGARAERARVLEQGRIELLSWPNGTPERRALEDLRKALQDERLPLPEYKP